MRNLLRRLRGPWVTDDPSPLPSNLDLAGGTYDIVHAALTRGTTVFNGTAALTPPQLERAALEVTSALKAADPLMDGFRDAMAASPTLAAAYADQFDQTPEGEQGDLTTMRSAWRDAHADLTTGDLAYGVTR